MSGFYNMVVPGAELRNVELKNYIEANDDGYLLGLLREANHNFYYAFVHTNLINGLNPDTTFVTVYPWWKTVIIAADCTVGVLTAAACALYASALLHKKRSAGIQ